jgi:SAM-dependent methyltransferase
MGLRAFLTRPARVVRRRLALALFGVGVDGLDVDGFVPLRDLGVAAPGRVPYSSSGPTVLWRALRGLPIGSDDVFVDYGSGKGFVVLQAAVRYPFRKVVGVEISDELTRIARENVARAQHRLKAQVELFVADAENWSLPDEATYVYMYKPFSGQLFETVLGRVLESLDRRPRDLVFIYANPVQEDFVLETGRFKRIKASRGLHRQRPARRVHVYLASRREDPDLAAR